MVEALVIRDIDQLHPRQLAARAKFWRERDEGPKPKLDLRSSEQANKHPVRWSGQLSSFITAERPQPSNRHLPTNLPTHQTEDRSFPHQNRPRSTTPVLILHNSCVHSDHIGYGVWARLESSGGVPVGKCFGGYLVVLYVVFDIPILASLEILVMRRIVQQMRKFTVRILGCKFKSKRL